MNCETRVFAEKEIRDGGRRKQRRRKKKIRVGGVHMIMMMSLEINDQRRGDHAPIMLRCCKNTATRRRRLVRDRHPGF
jgi:hypothetical protein